MTRTPWRASSMANAAPASPPPIAITGSAVHGLDDRRSSVTRSLPHGRARTEPDPRAGSYKENCAPDRGEYYSESQLTECQREEQGFGKRHSVVGMAQEAIWARRHHRRVGQRDDAVSPELTERADDPIPHRLQKEECEQRSPMHRRIGWDQKSQARNPCGVRGRYHRVILAACFDGSSQQQAPGVAL